MSYPLYVTLNPDGRHHNKPLDLSPFHSIITPHINRIRQFILHSRNEFNPALFNHPLFRSHLPQLRRLVIDWNQCTLFCSDHVVNGIFTGGTPLLTSVELQGDGGVRVRPPCGAVTTLTLGNVNTSRKWNAIHFHAFLAAMPRLTSLYIDGEIIGSWRDPEPVMMPSLMSLDINFGHSNYLFVACIITTLKAPNLESLTLRGVDLLYLAAILESRYPALQSLHFYNVFIDYSAKCFATVLTMLPSVTHLSLIGGDVHEASGILANNIYGADILLPELNSLRFEPLDDKADSIYDLISHRLTYGKPITRLQSSSFDAISPKHHVWLRERLELEEFPLPKRYG
jgi:hypothetical protein